MKSNFKKLDPSPNKNPKLNFDKSFSKLPSAKKQISLLSGNKKDLISV